MRRWLAALACTFMLAALAGCAKLPPGVDGDLTDGWAPMPAAGQFRPADHVCHTEQLRKAPESSYSPVPCTGPHLEETFFLGELTGAPARAENAFRPAYQQCAKRATAFLGEDWRLGWVVTQPVLPSDDGWAGGARWYRCDVAETSPTDGSLVRRSGGLQGALRPGGRLRMGCIKPTIDAVQVTDMRPVACSGGHGAEFAGLWNAPGGSMVSVTSAQMEKGCHAAIARFAGIPDDGDIGARVGWLSVPPDDTMWEFGDHAYRCFLWLNGETMKGSYRNAGTKKLKIHYVYR
jgi:hypothetical protein